MHTESEGLGPGSAVGTVAFERALEEWRQKALVHVDAAEAYRVAHAGAMLHSDGKNEAMRKADADAATSELRLTRDRSEVSALACYHRLLFLRGQER